MPSTFGYPPLLAEALLIDGHAAMHSDPGTVSGPGAVELAVIRCNLGLIDDPAERERLLAGARADLARLLGDGHPDTILSDYIHAATGVEQMRATADQLAVTCERFALHDVLARLQPECISELGDLRAELGDLGGAAAAYERATRGGEPRSDLAELAGYLALWRGAPGGALRVFDRALADRPVPANPPFHIAYARAKLELGRARALRAAGRPGEARPALERSLEGMHEIEDRSVPTQQRRLYRARAEYALVLAATHGPPSRIRADTIAAVVGRDRLEQRRAPIHVVHAAGKRPSPAFGALSPHVMIGHCPCVRLGALALTVRHRDVLAAGRVGGGDPPNRSMGTSSRPRPPQPRSSRPYTLQP